MTKDIAKFVRKCENCKLNKHRQYTKEEMVITETPEKPFDSLIIDLIGPLSATNGKLYVVTLICDLTKYLVCVTVPDKSAKVVVKAIFEKFKLVYGPMKNMRTDCGTEFTCENGLSPSKSGYSGKKPRQIQSLYTSIFRTKFGGLGKLH